ncbi:hypothetical protein [Microcoleus sp. D3_18a_C4]
MMEWKGFDLEGDRTSKIFKAGDRTFHRLQQIPLNLSKIRQPSSP